MRAGACFPFGSGTANSTAKRQVQCETDAARRLQLLCQLFPLAKLMLQTRTRQRSQPFGAEVTDAGVNFRVWAPRHNDAELVLFNGRVASRAIQLEPDGK